MKPKHLTLMCTTKVDFQAQDTVFYAAVDCPFIEKTYFYFDYGSHLGYHLAS